MLTGKAFFIRGFWWAVLVLAAPLACACEAAPAPPRLAWEDSVGVVLTTDLAVVQWDQDGRRRGPGVRLLPDGPAVVLDKPQVEHPGPGWLVLTYDVALDGPATRPTLHGPAAGQAGLRLRARRELSVVARDGGEYDLVEVFTITPSAAIGRDVEIDRPFRILPANAAPVGAAPSTTPANSAPVGASSTTPAAARFLTRWPLKNGYIRPAELGDQPLRGEFRLGNWILDDRTSELGLGVVQVEAAGRFQAAVCGDPRFSTLFEVRRAGANGPGAEVAGALRYRYAGTKVPLDGPEVRRFGLWLAPPAVEAASSPLSNAALTADVAPTTGATGTSRPQPAIDAFFRLMLPDVPPGAAWLHEIAMVGYDYLSDNGAGWDRDVDALAGWLTPAERARVALCYHGWYDGIGSYAYDPAAGRMKEEWTAMPRTRKVPLTRTAVRQRLARARRLGFRVLWYFGDGLQQDSGIPQYRADWNLADAAGRPLRNGWEGPDTYSRTYPRNPAHPEVVAWYRGYLAALLAAYGDVVDGFVWDETFYARLGDIAARPRPAYADRANLDLIKSLAAQVFAADPRKVFLSSDDVGIAGLADTVGYAMVAHGTYQDSWCLPAAWSFGLLPNWRNTLWSCNWHSLTHLDYTRFGVEAFGTPVAISNGWGDDRGPAQWTAQQRDDILGLFRRRLARTGRVRWLDEDPARLLATGPDGLAPSDELKDPPGLVNWALASRGAGADASSQDPHYPPGGVIDGVRDAAGWGAGHGWASQAGQKLPQHVEVRLAGPREISRLMVITYQAAPPDTARKWGVKDYRIEIPDPAAGPAAGPAAVPAAGAAPGAASPAAWKTIVREDRGRVMMARVHVLDKPVRIDRFRVVVTAVAASDGRARLLQVEAWGRS